MREHSTNILYREKNDEPIKGSKELAKLLKEMSVLVTKIEEKAKSANINMDENAKF